MLPLYVSKTRWSLLAAADAWDVATAAAVRLMLLLIETRAKGLKNLFVKLLLQCHFERATIQYDSWRVHLLTKNERYTSIMKS